MKKIQTILEKSKVTCVRRKRSSDLEPFSPAEPKIFRRAAWLVSPQSGRSMIEMLAVLAIIGVLSITALVGFTYAMNKHRANTIYNDVHLLALHVMDTGKGRVPADFYSESGLSYDIDTTTYADGFVVKVAAVSEKVCDRIMDVNDPSIEKIYVGSEETTTCSGTQDIGFMFLYDGTFTSGGGTSGGSSGGISSGGSTDPVDPCAGIVSIKDCGATDDMLDQNGCLIVQKISCGSGSYCSGQTCEPCPAADTCSGESCCALTGPDDVCGNPTKEIGTISTITHSDLNGNGCCESSTEESCSLNPITPRTCTPTCDGTCQSGVCETDALCNSGTLSDDGQFCISNDRYTWDEAFAWCETNDRHLATMYEVCPNWNGETGIRCPVIARSISGRAWTASAGASGNFPYHIDPSDGFIHSSARETSYRALCK